MTPQEIDAAVAEKVMGWKSWASPCVKHGEPDDCWLTGDESSPIERKSRDDKPFGFGWSPSTDMNHAVEAVDHRFGTSCSFQLDNGLKEVNGVLVGGWTCRIEAPGESGEATAGTPEIAICLAALRAVGVEVE